MTVPTYKAVHFRLGRDRGPASAHKCVCGASAEHWAYQHKGETLTDGAGNTYSENFEDYDPMCRSCHFKLDSSESERRIKALALARAARTPESNEVMRAKLTGLKRSPEAIENYKNSWTPERRASHAEKVRAAHRRKASA